MLRIILMMNYFIRFQEKRKLSDYLRNHGLLYKWHIGYQQLFEIFRLGLKINRYLFFIIKLYASQRDLNRLLALPTSPL